MVTFYTVFVIDLASRRVQILGSTPHPEALFMDQVVRTLAMTEHASAVAPHVLFCDRDRKWSSDVRRRLQDAGIRVVVTPPRAPNASAFAERFVRSIKEETLDRLIPCGERHFRRAVTEYVDHYHGERNHQGLDNRLVSGEPVIGITSRVRRHSRLGGLLNFYERRLPSWVESRRGNRAGRDIGTNAIVFLPIQGMLVSSRDSAPGPKGPGPRHSE